MMIKEIFEKDNLDVIEGVINNIKSENCENKMCKYIFKGYKDENVAKIEKDYISLLRSKLSDFLTELAIKYFKDKSEKTLIETLKSLIKYGSESIDNIVCEEDVEDTVKFCFYCSDDEAYPYIKKFMLDTFKEYKDNLNMTQRESELATMNSSIALYKEIIDNYNKNIEEQKKQLKEAEAKLEAFKKEE